MSRGEHIGQCCVCGQQYKWGDCFTAFCFEHDPAQAFSRALSTTPRRVDEPHSNYVCRVQEAAARDPYR